MTDQSAESACEMAWYAADGNVIFECERTDTEPVAIGDDTVRICPRHRSWMAAMGTPIDSPGNGRS